MSLKNFYVGSRPPYYVYEIPEGTIVMKLTEMEERIANFVNCWEIVSKSMLYRQRWLEKKEDFLPSENAIDNLVRHGIIKKLTVKVGDKLTYVLFPANTVIQL